MPEDGFTAKVNDGDLNRLISGLRILAGDVFLVPVLKAAVDDGANMIANSAKERHFFIGTGAGAAAKALDHELDFKNPDGSLRFKVRTANLLNSIQATPAVASMGSVKAAIKVGMRYARAIEEGAPGRRAFPYMRPAVEANRFKIRERMRQMLSKMLTRFAGGRGA